MSALHLHGYVRGWTDIFTVLSQALQALLKSREDTVRILAVLARGMLGKVALSNTSKALKMSDLVVVSAAFPGR